MSVNIATRESHGVSSSFGIIRFTMQSCHRTFCWLLWLHRRPYGHTSVDTIPRLGSSPPATPSPYCSYGDPTMPHLLYVWCGFLLSRYVYRVQRARGERSSQFFRLLLVALGTLLIIYLTVLSPLTRCTSL